MTATNDCDLVRVFTRRAAAGSVIADQTIKSNEAFQVVMQAEAGQALFNNGGPYRLNVVVRDLTDGTTVNAATQAGNFGDANWPGLAMQFAFPAIAAQGAGKQDHIYQATVVSTAGAVDPIVAFAESDLLIITRP
jgi:hypothetical protein